jgi:HPt (histidine-containing phosphotransfer) domain-containing protein
MEEVAGLFLLDGASRIRAMREAAQAGDARGMGAAAHALKGSCAMLGATRLAQLCAALESAARQGWLEQARQQAPLIEAEYERVSAALAQLVLRRGEG